MSSVHDRSEDDAVDGAASGGNQPSSDSQGFVFAGADGRFVTPELIELRPLPRRTPTWLKTALAAAGLGVAVIGWSLYGGSSSEPVETAAVPMARSDDELAEAKLAEEQRRHSTEVESKEVQQHASVSHNDRDPLVQDLLARERARAT